MKTVWLNANDESFYGGIPYVGPAKVLDDLHSSASGKGVWVKTPAIGGMNARFIYAKIEDVDEDI